MIKVSGENLPDNPDFVVFDMTGRIIRNGVLEADKSIQVGALSPGTYMLQLMYEGTVIRNARFIKQ